MILAPSNATSSYQAIPRLIPNQRKPRQAPINPLPLPQTPALPEPCCLATIDFTIPTRRILSPQDLSTFLKSPSYDLILAFVFRLCDSMNGLKISSVKASDSPPIINQLLATLDSIERLILDCPPQDQAGSRFGNPAFRQFCDLLTTSSASFHTALLAPLASGSPVQTPLTDLKLIAAIKEISTYLEQSFGNRARIDYGSGHELNFTIWLLALNRLGLAGPASFPALALLIFPRYLRLLRNLQSTYYLEPAGSHGVWGLDDYHFLPFLFGAAQLKTHPYLRPLSIHNEAVLEEEADEYIYLDMVRFTMASKTVKGLKWTQPMLDDISGAKSWEKVEQGMRRMFVKEVLHKLPIMQHFLFGSLIPAMADMSKEDDIVVQEQLAQSVSLSKPHGHAHKDMADAWGECCGIRIPSTVAASREEGRTAKAQILRRLPFD